jgi:hypothetical protein
MGLGLAVLEEMPRHSGHRLLAKKKARPQQGQRDGLQETAGPGSRQRLRSKKECRCRAEGCSSAQILSRSIIYPERKAIQSLLQQALMGHAHGHLPLKRFPVFVTHHFGSKCRSVRLDGLAKQENLALELFSVCHFVASPAKEWHSSWLRTLNFLALPLVCLLSLFRLWHVFRIARRAR